MKALRAVQAGFTLVEMVTVIVITGIISGAVAVFIQRPVQGYFDAARRATLADTADAALGLIGRELRQALPNSTRVTSSGGAYYLEFIPTVAAGRYQGSAAESCFASPGCTALTTLGSVIAATGEFVGKSVVIFNYYNNAGGGCGATLPSAYCGQNIATLTGTTDGGGQDVLAFAVKRFYPAGGSPSRRLQIVDTPVSYVCDPATGQLVRYSGYAAQATQPAVFTGATAALVAGDVTGCNFKFQAGAYSRYGVIALQLTLSDSGESVTLYHQVHVDDSP